MAELTLDKMTENLLQPRQSRVWRKFLNDKRAWFGSIALIVIFLAAILAQRLAPYDPFQIDMKAFQAGPTPQHWLGTDTVGRDVLSRLIYGARVSLSVGLVSVVINVLIGTFFGAISGYYGGTIDQIIMRLSDAFLSFPMLVIVIVAVSIVGPSIMNIMIVIGVMGWPTICRIVRGEFLSLRNEEFVTAAIMVGAQDLRIIFRHILPNTLAPIIVAATFGAASVILLEGSLSFLGLGVQPPTASWGNMLNDAQSIVILEKMPWLWVPPGLAIAITVLSFNFVGDAMRDAFDPTTRDV